MKKVISKLVLVSIILNICLYVFTGFSLADERSDLNSQINATNQKIQEEQDAIEQVKTEKSEVAKEVESLSNQISTFENEIDDLETKINDLTKQINEKTIEIEQKQKEYDETQELLDQRLVSAYENGNVSYLTIILNSKSFLEMVDNYYLLNKIVEADNELMDEIERTKKEIEDAKTSMEEDKEQLNSAKTEKEQKAKELNSAKSQKNAKLSQLTETEKEIQEKLDALQEENRKTKAQLEEAEKRYAAQIAALNNKNQGQTTSNNNNNSTVVTGSGVLQPPVSGVITATMYYSSGTYHGALDYGIPVGTTVRAAADGVVLFTSYQAGGYGNYMVIQHANGIRTWYGHGNGVFYVSAGQTVSRGQAIMQSGNSGRSSGPHLHFEVRVAPYTYVSGGGSGDCRRDPRNYF